MLLFPQVSFPFFPSITPLHAKKFVAEYIQPTMHDLTALFLKVISYPDTKQEKEAPPLSQAEQPEKILERFLPAIAETSKQPKNQTQYALSLIPSVSEQPDASINESVFSTLFSDTRASVESLFTFMRDRFSQETQNSFYQSFERKKALDKIIRDHDKNGLLAMAEELCSSVWFFFCKACSESFLIIFY